MPEASKSHNSVLGLLQIMAAVFAGLMVIGIALPALPLHIHDELKFGGFIVGSVASAQFAAALISRLWAGRLADRRGGKLSLALGLATASIAGLIYLASIAFLGQPALSVSLLLIGRATLGAAESLIITGAVAWGFTIAGNARAGRVIAWVGTAMYAALAIGAPVGGALYQAFGFVSTAFMTIALPLVGLAIALPMAFERPSVKHAPSIVSVIGVVWKPGVGLAMSSLGFGSMMTFVSLMFAENEWQPIWSGLTAFAVSFIAARVLFGDTADRVGGAYVNLLCTVVEAAGLALIWLAPEISIAIVGAALTGFGYSLVYPGLGVEAVQRAPPQSRGLAMGAYTAFLDLSLAVTSPLLGGVASAIDLGTVFLISAIFALFSSVVAIILIKERTQADLEGAG